MNYVLGIVLSSVLSFITGVYIHKRFWSNK